MSTALRIMFRRSFLIFVAFCFLALCLVVGWALTGLSGPDSAIAEARADLDASRSAAAIPQHHLAEQHLGPSGRP